jgi:hypothetical protein
MAPAPLGLAYRIKEKNVGEAGRAVAAPYVVWDQEHVAVTANEALAAEASPGSDRSASVEAESFLQELLADGAVATKQVKAECEGAGISWPPSDGLRIVSALDPIKRRGRLAAGFGLSRECALTGAKMLTPARAAAPGLGLEKR